MAAPRICSVEECDKPAITRGWCSMHYARWRHHGDLNWQRKRNTCTMPDCSKPVHGNGFCRMHYNRVRRNGSPTKTKCAANGALNEWLERHKDYQGEACLIWPFGRTAAGYGLTSSENRYAHRDMCALAHGPAPAHAFYALHSCGNGHLGCVNPNHLYWGTSSQNQSDRLKHGTETRGEDVKNSKLTEDNIREIRSLAGTMTKTKIAERYGVSRHAIFAVLTGRSWAWVK